MTAHTPRPMFHQSSGSFEATAPFGPSAPVLDLRALFTNLRRQKVWILLPAISAVLLVLMVYPLIPLRFQASTQLLIDPRGLQIIDKELSPGAQSGEASLPLVESQLRVITSERVLRDLIARENLQNDPEFIEPSGLVSQVLGGINRMLGVTETREDPMLRALRTVQRRVSVRRTERSYIIDIFFEASTAAKAAHLANALATAYLESDLAARNDVAKRVEQSLSGRLAELRNQVRGAEEKVETYKAENNIIGASGRLINEQQLLELNTQLGAARGRSAELKARTDLIESARRRGADPAAISEAVQSPTIGQMRGQYLELKRRQSDVMTLLGARHPDVITLEAQARTVRTQIKEELDRIARAAWVDYQRSKSKEIALARDVESLKGEALTTNRAFVRLRELEREAESSRGVYESFLRRTKEVGEQQAIDSANLRVISRAVPPREAMNLPLAFLLVGAIVAGLGLGVLFVWLRDMLSTPALLREPNRRASTFQSA